MHSAAEELSTGPRLTTVMKPIPVRGKGGWGGGEREREEVGKYSTARRLAEMIE